jgi:hypothetical protein
MLVCRCAAVVYCVMATMRQCFVGDRSKEVLLTECDLARS